MALRRLVLPTLALLLAGCGFHLRGALPLPEAMARTHISAPSGSALRYALEAQLRAAGGEVAGSEGEATATLTLHAEKLRSRILSVDPLGRAREYALGLSVSYSLSAADGTTLVPVQNSLIERDLRVDPDNVLAQEGEREVVEREMQRAAAQQILRRLRSQADAPPAEAPAAAQ